MSNTKIKKDKTTIDEQEKNKSDQDIENINQDEIDQNSSNQFDKTEDDLSILSREELEQRYLAILEEKNNLDQEKQKLYNQFLLSVANQDNLKKRYEKELSDLKKYFVVDIAREIINVMDNISCACEDKYDGEKSFNRIIEVAKLTKKTISDLFDKFHIQKVKTNEGDDFDYDKHNAISYIESKDYAEGKIVKVMQQGYMLHDRLLRPSLVSVAKKK